MFRIFTDDTGELMEHWEKVDGVWCITGLRCMNDLVEYRYYPDGAEEYLEAEKEMVYPVPILMRGKVLLYSKVVCSKEELIKKNKVDNPPSWATKVHCYGG